MTIGLNSTTCSTGGVRKPICSIKTRCYLLQFEGLMHSIRACEQDLNLMRVHSKLPWRGGKALDPDKGRECLLPLHHSIHLRPLAILAGKGAGLDVEAAAPVGLEAGDERVARFTILMPPPAASGRPDPGMGPIRARWRRPSGSNLCPLDSWQPLRPPPLGSGDGVGGPRP